MTAAYDNPDTMCREIYAHGFLVTYYAGSQLFAYFPVTPVQEQFLKYARSFGAFNEGHRYGKVEEIPEDTSQVTISPDDMNFTIG